MTSRALPAVAVVAALIAGFAVYSLLRRDAPSRPTPLDATSVSSAPAAGVPAKLAEHIPVFTLADTMNHPRTLQDWPDRALIVNFWATWCAPCRREIPLLKRIQQEHGAEGFQVIGIAVDFREQVLEYATQMQIDYPVLIGEQDALDAAAAFGVDAIGFPFTVFSDRQGRIITAHVGELTAPQADVILDAVSGVDSGAYTPEQARTAIESGLDRL
jgi:thiol-disulfide isomerase/thioredoxin